MNLWRERLALKDMVRVSDDIGDCSQRDVPIRINGPYLA